MEGAGAQLHYSDFAKSEDVSLWLVAGMSGVGDGKLPASIMTEEIQAQEVSTVSAIVCGASSVEISNADRALTKAGIKVLARNLNSARWTWVVARADEAEAVRKLHALWCESPD